MKGYLHSNMSSGSFMPNDAVPQANITSSKP